MSAVMETGSADWAKQVSSGKGTKLPEDIVLCAWCGRARRSNGAWVKLRSRKTPAHTHGICPECMASEMCAAAANRNRA